MLVEILGVHHHVGLRGVIDVDVVQSQIPVAVAPVALIGSRERGPIGHGFPRRDARRPRLLGRLQVDRQVLVLDQPDGQPRAEHAPAAGGEIHEPAVQVVIDRLVVLRTFPQLLETQAALARQVTQGEVDVPEAQTLRNESGHGRVAASRLARNRDHKVAALLALRVWFAALTLRVWFAALTLRVWFARLTRHCVTARACARHSP